MNRTFEHTKLGIASFWIAVIFWIYFPGLAVVLFKTELINYLFPKETGFIAQVIALLLIIFFLLGVPLVGFLTGLVFGIGGVGQRTKKRTFGVIGLILNLLPLILAVVYNFGIYF